PCGGTPRPSPALLQFSAVLSPRQWWSRHVLVVPWQAAEPGPAARQRRVALSRLMLAVVQRGAQALHLVRAVLKAAVRLDHLFQLAPLLGGVGHAAAHEHEAGA